MKPWIGFRLLLAFTLPMSCGEDGDKNPAVSLEGQWKVTSLEYYECTGSTDNSLRECGTFTFCATWEFKDGTNTIFYEGGGMNTATYTVYSENTIGLCSTSCSNMVYAIAGNKLTLSTVTPGANDCMMRYTFEKI